jgi:hypothetical protein
MQVQLNNLFFSSLGYPFFQLLHTLLVMSRKELQKIEHAPKFDNTNPPGTLFNQRSSAEYKSFPAGDAATAIPISKKHWNCYNPEIL